MIKITNYPAAILALLATFTAFIICRGMGNLFLQIAEKRHIAETMAATAGLLWIFPALIGLICGIFVYWMAEDAMK